MTTMTMDDAAAGFAAVLTLRGVGFFTPEEVFDKLPASLRQLNPDWGTDTDSTLLSEFVSALEQSQKRGLIKSTRDEAGRVGWTVNLTRSEANLVLDYLPGDSRHYNVLLEGF